MGKGDLFMPDAPTAVVNNKGGEKIKETTGGLIGTPQDSVVRAVAGSVRCGTSGASVGEGWLAVIYPNPELCPALAANR